MKKLILVLLLLAGSAFAQTMGSCWDGTTAASTTVTVNTPTTPSTSSGSLLLVATTSSINSSTWTIADSSGTNSYTQTPSGYSTDSASNNHVDLRYVANAAAITSLTVTFSTSVSGRVVLCEVTGAALTTPLDTSVNSAGTTFQTSLTSGTFTTTNANDILIYVIGTVANAGASFTAGTGYTIQTNGSCCTGSQVTAIQSKTVTSIQTSQTTSMSWPNSVRVASVFAAFKAAPVATVIHRKPVIF